MPVEWQAGMVVAIYQKVGVLRFSGYQGLEKESPADCRMLTGEHQKLRTRFNSSIR